MEGCGWATAGKWLHLAAAAVAFVTRWSSARLHLIFRRIQWWVDGNLKSTFVKCWLLFCAIQNNKHYEGLGLFFFILFPLFWGVRNGKRVFIKIKQRPVCWSDNPAGCLMSRKAKWVGWESFVGVGAGYGGRWMRQQSESDGFGAGCGGRQSQQWWSPSPRAAAPPSNSAGRDARAPRAPDHAPELLVAPHQHQEQFMVKPLSVWQALPKSWSLVKLHL